MLNKQQNNKDLMQYAGLATQWLVMLGLAIYLGILLDKQIGPQSRIATILFPLLAIGISLWQLIRKFNKPKK